MNCREEQTLEFEWDFTLFRTEIRAFFVKFLISIARRSYLTSIQDPFACLPSVLRFDLGMAQNAPKPLLQISGVVLAHIFLAPCIGRLSDIFSMVQSDGRYNRDSSRFPRIALYLHTSPFLLGSCHIF